MATSNASTKRDPVYNHEGARAVHNATPLIELRRSVMASLLFESSFYEDGQAHAKRVAELVHQCAPADVAQVAIDARERMYLRHMPLFLVRELARDTKALGTGTLVAETLARVIQRPDEISEYLAIYWGGRKPNLRRKGGDKTLSLSAASKRGLASAFKKFSRYQLAKYRKDDKAVSLRDALRLVQPKPVDLDQKALWKEVLDNTLRAFDTWEDELSAGKDKKAVFERLLSEKKLGGMAFLKNLRNMTQAGVSRELMRARFKDPKGFEKVLPFRFLAAARYAPALVDEINTAMLNVVAGSDKLLGTTIVLVDTSPSMDKTLSAKSEMTRKDAACGLAVYLREICDSARVFAFSQHPAEVKSYRGLPLVDQIKNAVPSNGTLLGAAIAYVSQFPHDRLIVVTDEESQDAVGRPSVDKAYMINLSTSKHGVGLGDWTRVTGWSDRIVDFIREIERPVQP